MTIPATMKGWTCRRYGGPEAMRLEELPTPQIKTNEVLIRVRATTVESADARIRALRLPRGFGMLGSLIFGFGGPRRPVLGAQASGIVVKTGARVASFEPGDAVVAVLGGRMGCGAEYVAVAEDALLVEKPEALSFQEGASLTFGGLTALDYLRKADVKPGEQLLVIGASGTVGSAFVQLARHYGACVTAVTSTGNKKLALALGASAVIDYSCTDFTAQRKRWDVIADTVGASSFAQCAPVLNERGRYLAIAGGLADMFVGRKGTKRSISGPAAERIEDMRELIQLAANGVFKPVIDSVYDFEEMREAHARVDTNRKRGSVVVLLTDWAR